MAYKRLTKQQWNSLPAYKKYQMRANTPDLYNYYQKRYVPARQKVGMVEDFSDDITGDPNAPKERPPTADPLGDFSDNQNPDPDDYVEDGKWREKAAETTATLQRLMENTGATFLEFQLNTLGKQIVAGAETIKNPLVDPDSFMNNLGFDVSAGRNKKILTDLFGENDTISSYQLATSLGYTKEEFSAIPAQTQRIAAATPAMRELFKDQDYKATPFELEDAVLNGKTAEEVAEYVDPRYVTEAEAIAAFEAANGYKPSAEEVQDRIGQAEYDNATDAAGQETYVNRTANHEQAELEDLADYVDKRQITAEEVKEFAAQNGLEISDEEAERLAQQNDQAEIEAKSKEIFDDFDERFVSRAELEGIARAEGYDPASLTEEDYAEFSGETSQSGAAKNIDARATTEEELTELYEQRTGLVLSPTEAKELLAKAKDENNGVVPNDKEFKSWARSNIELDLGVQVGRLATSVRNAVFGTGPGGRPKTLQEILDEMLGPPGGPWSGSGLPSPLVVKTTPGATSSPVGSGLGRANVQVEIKFPVPLPVNGPPIIIPVFKEGVYEGPSSAGELFVGEDGVITQVKENIETTVGQITGDVVQVFDAAGKVVKAIPLGALNNSGWKEGDPNPNDLVLDESGNPALIDADGKAIDPETGFPVYEDPDAADADADNTFDLDDQDNDGIPDAIDDEVTVVNNDPVVSRSPYEDGSADEAFRNSSWPDPDPDPDAQDTYSRQIEQMFLDYGLDTNQWPEGDKFNITGPDGQPVDANEDGVYTVEELTAVGITRAAGYDPRMFLGNDARLVLDTLEGTLDGLGLDVDDIETILGRIETDLQNVTTAEDLETFRTNLITELTDPDTGLPSMGINGVELADALVPITGAVGDLEDAINDVGRNVGLRAVEDDPNTPDVDESRPATGLYAEIDALVDQGLSRAEAVDQALADLSDQLGTSTADILEQIGTTEANLAEDIEAVAEDVTNLGEALNDRIDTLVDQGLSRAEAVDQALADLADQLGTSTADILEQIGTTEANLAEDIEAVAGDVEAVAGDLSELAGIVNGYIAQGLTNDEALAQAISDLSDKLGVTEDTLLTSLGETEETILDAVEGVSAQIDATNVSILDLNELVKQYELDGKTRDEAIQLAISDLSDKVGVTETNLLTSIGESEETILGAIEGVNAQIDATNVNIGNLNDLIVQYELDGKTRDEALSLALSDLSTDLGITKEEILSTIGESEETILGAIDASEESTDEYLTYISQIIGIPATDLTQADIDTVVGLIGEDEAITEINNDNRLYDVNFDGVINDLDVGILQGYVDIGVEGVGEIPATGLYADAAQRQLELTGYISDQDDITRGLISDEGSKTRGLMGAATFFNALMGAGDISGTQVDVSTPDPARINYMYDFEDIFATPQQKSLFPSPYGKPQMAQQQQMAQRQASTSGPLQIGGMAQGGKVDYDFTDEIMQIMRYGDN